MIALIRRLRARKKFSQAFKAHRDAIDRGDTRSIKATRQALTAAQHERLRAGA